MDDTARISQEISRMIADGNYADIIRLCEDMEISRPAQPSIFYGVHLVALLATNSLEETRFLWLRTSNYRTAELDAIWNLGQHLWKRKFAQFHAAAQTVSVQLSPLNRMAIDSLILVVRNHVIDLFSRAYRTIRLSDAAGTLTRCISLISIAALGLDVPAAIERCISDGWRLEGEYLLPEQIEAKKEVSVGSNQLEVLASYVSHLEEPL